MTDQNKQNPQGKRSQSSTWKGQVKWLISGVIVPILAGLGVVIWAAFFSHSASLEVILLKPIPDPHKGAGWIQVLVLENAGNGVAQNMEVKINCPQTVYPIDYSIDSVCHWENETRTQSYLKLTVPQFQAGATVVVSWMSDKSGISPSDIDLAYDEKVVPPERIHFVEVKPSRWETPK